MIHISRIRASRFAFILVVLGTAANFIVAPIILGERADIGYQQADWLADFIKHTISFPGLPIAPSMFGWLLEHFKTQVLALDPRFSHFHNMPLTVALTLMWRPLFALVDPAKMYFVFAACFVTAWLYAIYRYADDDFRPRAIGLALFNYPMITLLVRGNLFAGITAICLTAMLCRRKLDWISVLLFVIAVNIRPNVAILVLPLLRWDHNSLKFLFRAASLGGGIGLVSLWLDHIIYPAYTFSTVLRGLALYNKYYVLGPFGTEYVTSLWSALRHIVPVTGRNSGICTLAGLLPLVFVWTWRERMSYAASCFLAIGSCTLATAVLGDYHLLIFVVPLLLLEPGDPAEWPILVGSCWMLIPKHYNPIGELAWQTFLNPIGLIVAVALVVLSYRAGGQRELGLSAREIPNSRRYR